ncbi:hypothetical protein M0805_006306 [Coniferiporia weirii]|nr:hypothetical protein M0805_006306 [Coniferiporia weirii]
MPRLQPAVFAESDIFVEGLDKDYLRLEARPVWTRSLNREQGVKSFETLDILDLSFRSKPIIESESRCPLRKHLAPKAVVEIKHAVKPVSELVKDIVMDDPPATTLRPVLSASDEADGEPEMEKSTDAEGDTASEVGRSPSEEHAMIEELRAVAFTLKNKLMERWARKLAKNEGAGMNGDVDTEERAEIQKAGQTIKPDKKGVKRTTDNLLPKKGSAKCTFGNCPWSFSTRAQSFNRHVHTHYPEAYFCPICNEIACRDDSLDRHLLHKGRGRCVNSDMAKHFRISRGDDGKIKMGFDRKFFNFYFLGVLEEYDMSEEHFEIIARRRRGAPLY